ncbi:MAG: ATP-binding sensor histidine kinase [Aulosira sp. DedQUE10]|nr:ATP-binding sensor histidine kinase [Aulosira sp. DedQUE10]
MLTSFASIPGYHITEKLYNGSRTLVYRGYRKTDSLPVVMKLLKNPYPGFSELLSFRNQYTITKNLNSPLIVQTYSLEPFQNGYALVMEDFGGISLKEWRITQRRQSLQEFLEIAIALCDILNILYQERIIHKDIKPSNILINPNTKQVKLIDFSIASLLPRETQTLVNPNVLEGTLAYISPEQTGRMNRGIDYRTDFYSLGVTFYELLTGELPFASNDPMELVHCHLAKMPTELGNREEILQVLSDIVMKLMAKNAEDRYQSALGLKFDLEKCLHQLQVDGAIDNFEIAQRDVCDRFIIPDKLYGRETEVETLLQAFDRVSLGATEMMLVAGFSGIGKTAVVNEVHKPIVRQRGYFIKGKYDQFQRNIPFSAFVQAFRDLMGQLLTESDVQIEQWKNKILEAVGENGQVIIEVIPELTRIISEQPAAVELSGNAAENRFNLLFQKFTQVFTSAEHPLVIFLDDLQWADSASLKLMQLLMADTGHLLLIGAYRDNEVQAGHPLILTLSDIQKTLATINTITLAPLSQVTVNQLVADTLKCTEYLAENFSVFLYQKTQGNPFFATQFLKALHQDGLIEFTPPTPPYQGGARGGWQCDITQVKIQAVTDDVVAFMSFQLRKLPLSTQQVLQLAACIGNSFDLGTLAIVSQQSQIETAATLWKALQEGLILPIGDVYKFYVGQETLAGTSENQEIVTYKFLHDRVQQAAYSLIADDQKQLTHLQIGRLLLQATAIDKQDENTFAIANHLNKGASLITDEQEQQLVHLNLKAGQKAKSATAYGAAFNYYQTGISLLQGDRWQRHYDLTLALYEGAAESAYLNIDFEQVEPLAQVVLNHAQSWLDRSGIYVTKIQTCIAQSQMHKALQLAREVLSHLGVQLPQPTPADIQQAFEQTQALLAGREIESLLELPQMTAAHPKAAMMILSNIIAVVYRVAPELFPLLILAQMNLSVQHGNAPESTYGYVLYGLMQSAQLNDIETGYHFGLLGVNLLERIHAPKLYAKTIFGFYAFLSHWREPIKNTLSGYLHAYTKALETGDLEYVGISLVCYEYAAYLNGQELTTLRQAMAEHRKVMQQFRLSGHLDYQTIYYHIVLNLMEPTVEPERLFGEHYDEAISIQRHLEANESLALFQIYVCKLFLSYLFEQYDRAIANARMIQQYLGAGTGLPHVPAFYFYSALLQLAVYPDASDADKAVILEQVAVNLEKLTHWAVHAPSNQAHRCALIAAERCRVLGQKAEASEHYDRAISLAKANEYLHEESLANELAAKFYLEWGKQRLAGEYMIEAYYSYARWGAKAKVADLEKRYPQLLAPILQQARSTLSTHETIFALGTLTSTSSQTSSSSVSGALDLAAILKASQIISSEIELEKLLSSLLRIAIENAGANKCVLMLLQDSRLLIKGSITQGTQPVMLQSLPVEDSQDIPLKLIYKVKHNRQTVVLLDATGDITLANDPYIRSQQPKSILCSPILHQGKLLGILYLENNLATEVFTSDRVELLNLLCAQAAISLENALLYERSQQYAQQLEQALHKLQNAQLQIVQSEKMSALGNLVAGIAHEMNNPLGFISVSLKQTKPTIADITEHLKLYQETFPNKSEEIIDHAESIDLEYSLEDLPQVIDSMTMACDRLKNISTSLRTFSRADKDYKVPFQIHEGIDSTILILKHRLKANEQRPAIEVVTNYGDLPAIECFPGQLNQVFMNILANAVDALDESNVGRSFASIEANPNRITVTTSIANKLMKIAIADNGKGISEEIQPKIFDHSFTTKAVGKGTGLGLAIAKSIVEETHNGKLYCNSVLSKGTEFIMEIPQDLRKNQLGLNQMR